MKPTEQHREMFRREILHGNGFIGPLHATEELKRARFFLETMEKFVETSENAEVKQLEVHAQELSEEAKDEFWQWHYPIHWQDIFGVRIRSAFCSQLCSHIEATLGDIAHRIQVIERCQVELRHIKGSTLEQCRLYFAAFARFDGPPPDLWKRMANLFRIRNVHVHQQGYAGDLTKDKDFASFLADLPEVGTQNDFIELRAGSCFALLAIAEEFHESLLDEYEAYRLRAITLETLTAKKEP